MKEAERDRAVGKQSVSWKQCCVQKLQLLAANRVLAGLSFMLLYPGNAARAADPQPYTVSLTSTGDAGLDAALNASSNLVSLENTNPVGPFALAGRIRGDYERLQVALESYGYYGGKIIITLHRAKGSDAPEIDGESSSVASWIDTVPAKEKISVNISAQRGPLFHLGRISVIEPSSGKELHLTAAQEKAFDLHTGMPAVASQVLGAQGRLTQLLMEEGHALATIAAPKAYLHPESHTLNIVYDVVPGPVLNIGMITLSGLKHTNPSFIRRRLTIHPGQLYQPGKIDAARQDLVNLGIFSNVAVRDASQKAVAGTMPLDFHFAEAKRHQIGAEAGYSTDLGIRGGVNWTHYNLFGNAERLKIAALVAGIGASAQQGLGYDFYADFLKPDFFGDRRNLSVRVEGLKQLFWSYRQTALLARVGVAQQLGKHWNLNYGVAGIQEKVEQFGVTRNYTIASLPISASFDNTGVSNPIIPATHGFRLNMGATPSLSLGSKGVGTSLFTIFNATASTYFDLANFGISQPGRSVFAFRATLGTIQGAGTYDIPPDQRLYAGGSATVRGYRWQGVGPQYGRTRYAIGGTSLDAGTIEYRQRVLSSFGFAGFIDAGQVGSNSAPFVGTVRVGTGGGLRYYTPIGPVRLDIGVPLNRPPRGSRWQLYIGLGETF